MNRKYIVSIGVVVSMLSGIASAGFVNDGFTAGNGTALHGRDQWQATHATSVMISNNAAAIPILQTLSNNVAPLSDAKVWTDFWTIPRPFVSATDAAPAVDPNTSAMFFVTNTKWAVVYGLGGAVTSVCTDKIFGGTIDTVANDGSTWHRVSVYHNYGAGNWSLFVDGSPIMTNMAFISSVPNYQWFSVQNGGGNASNVTWIDTVLITNRVPPSLTNSADGDTLSDAWELMYFGNFASNNAAAPAPNGSGFTLGQLAQLGANPNVLTNSEPGGTNLEEFVFGAVTPGIVSMDPTNSAPNAMRLVFTVGSNRTCTVLGGTSPNSLTSRGTFNTGPAGNTNWFVDPTALENTRFYYRVVATDGTYGFVDTNDVMYTLFVQSRVPRSEAGGSNFWVGVVVNYGASNTMNGTLGRQLAQGLADDDTVTVYYQGMTTFTYDGANWSGGGAIDLNTPIPFGVGMVITRYSSSPTDRAVFAGAMITNTSISLNLVQGWNMIAWPFEGSCSINAQNSGLMTSGSNNDYVWVYRNGVYKRLRKSSTVWLMSGGGTVPADVGTLRFGEGVFYSNNVSSLTWDPTSSP